MNLKIFYWKMFQTNGLLSHKFKFEIKIYSHDFSAFIYIYIYMYVFIYLTPTLEQTFSFLWVYS